MPAGAKAHEVYAHELGHAFGLGHTFTEVSGGIVARKSGHIMHESISGLGWDDEGIPGR